MKSKSLQILSLALLATVLASGAVHAKGGNGGTGMENGGRATSPGTAQRKQARTQRRAEMHMRTPDGTHADDAQARSEGGPSPDR